MKKLILISWILAGVCSHVSAQDTGYSQVKGFTPVEAGEHPRLLFRKRDLPEIRRRAKTPEGRKIVERLKATLNGAETVPPPELRHPAKNGYLTTVSLPEGAYSISHAAGFGMLYQLTGEQRYADLARECMDLGFAGVRDRDPQARYAMVFGHGQLRVGPSLAWTALAYDLCYDAWEPEYRRKVAQYLLKYDSSVNALENLSEDEQKKLTRARYTTKDMATRPKHGPASNHYGSITGGIGMALLAVAGDPEAGGSPVREWLLRNEKEAVKALTGFGKRGFFFEGQGPSHMGAYPAMVSYFQALRNVTGRDYISKNERLHWITLRWVAEVTRDKQGLPVYLARHEAMGQQYGSDVLKSSGGLSDNGRFSLGFGSLPESYHPAALWAFEQYFAKADEGRFDSLNYPHLAISALIHWPIGVNPENPETLLPKAYRDEEFGHYVFRNGWTGETDEIIVTAFTALRGGTRVKPWKSLPLKIRAYGKKHEIDLGWRDKGMKEVDFTTDKSQQSSSVALEGGTLLGVDYSGRSGAAGLVVLKGKGSFSAGYFGEFMAQSVNGFQVLTIRPDHMHPRLEADGDGVKIGGLKIRVEGNRFRFTRADSPTAMMDSFKARGIDPLIDAVSEETIRHPGKPDALLSFDYVDFEQQGNEAHLREAFGRGDVATAYNLRPEHLRPGVFGQAFPFRPGGKVESTLPQSDPEAESQKEHPLGFTGIMTAVKLPDGPEWNFAAGDQTVTFWLKFNEPRSGYALLVEPKNRGGFHMGFHPGPTIMLGGRFGSLNAPYPNDAGVWHLVALVMDSKRKLVTYWVDGEFAGRTKSKGGKGIEAGPTFIGARLNPGARYPGNLVEGDMDEFAIYRRALTAGEIMALYQAGQEGSSSLTGRSAPSQVAAYVDVDQDVGAAPLPVQFSAERSILPKEGARYEWDFGDGKTASGLTVKHQYLKEGLFTASLTVTDPKGNQSTAQMPIRVFNRPPVVAIERLANAGGELVLSASGSKDPDGGALRYQWTVHGKTLSGEKVTLPRLAPGSHEILCTAKDPQGGVGKGRFSISIPDAQGYRLPENPEKVVPGLHYHQMKLFRTVDPYAPGHPDVVKVTEFLNHGTVNELAYGAITSAGSGRYVVFAGYVAIPKDGTYTVMLDGLKRTRFAIGNELLIENASKFDRLIPPTTERIKLRRGLHRMVFYHPGHVLSKNVPYNFFFARVILEHEDGSRFVMGSGNLFRTPLSAEDVGSDLASLQLPIEAAAPVSSGNRAPRIRIHEQILSEMPGAKTLKLRAEVSDEDGDDVQLSWLMPDGGVYASVESITRVWTTGRYPVTVMAEDGRGGKTSKTQIIDVAGPEARSISFDFMNIKPGEIGVFPGERIGLVPSSSWNALVPASQRNMKGNAGDLMVMEPRFGLTLASPDQRAWLDQDGTPLEDLVVRMPGRNPSASINMPYAMGRSPLQRMMRFGAMVPEMQIEGIPYARYDVIVYLMGNARKASSPYAWYLQGHQKKKKRSKRRAPDLGEGVIRVNTEEVQFSTDLEHNRWQGHLSELSAENPSGNVVILRGLRGSSCNLEFSGSHIAGFQIVERR